MVLICWFTLFGGVAAEDGYRLWLRFDKISDTRVLNDYTSRIAGIHGFGNGELQSTAIHELKTGLDGLLGSDIPHLSPSDVSRSSVMLVEYNRAPSDLRTQLDPLPDLGAEGFVIREVQFNGINHVAIVAVGGRGLLYGVFHLLRHMQMHKALDGIDVIEKPSIDLRVLNHWDNLDRTVERGYAGFSIWNWHELPHRIDERYIDYARANASIGINGTVVTNVNANALVFRADYIEKVKALAAVFRPYGIKIYLTARFSAPIELGGLDTADPLDNRVISWWNDKVEEIYKEIPDFGGFLVKANSEGQPGPQDYGRNHAEGANMLADALSPHGGVVMWRAFVYSSTDKEDRAKQAYSEFVPLDGTFRSNVLIQVKNGPIDFQPREPVHPLFGAMPGTPIMMEFQITKEYLGQGTHLVGLAEMYEEVLQTDTYVDGPGSTVAKVIDGSLQGQQITGMAGVSNIGTARNWTGNLFGQADWYSFGRLAWDPYTTANEIFGEWAMLTFDHDSDVQATVYWLLSTSHETCVRYMTPLGIHHIMAAGHHYGPGPWVADMPRADWTSVYYHKADSEGVGFDRTVTGSNALSQYAPGFQEDYEDPETCPTEFLLWFHHVRWDQVLTTGRTLWDELCHQYHQGAKEVTEMRARWESLAGTVDEERHTHVAQHLLIQEREAEWWRDACIAYFQSFSKMPIPDGLAPPGHPLEYYESLSYPYAPGIRPRW